jgi:hypothetical protein
MVLLLYDPCRTNFLTGLVTAPADPPPTSNELTDTFNSLVSATEKLITKSIETCIPISVNYIQMFFVYLAKQ